MRSATVALVALAAIAMAYALWQNSPSHRGVKTARSERKEAPDFTLPQLDGGQLRLSSYRGKVVLLDFWATWCTPCREETPHFVEMQQKYGDRGLQIIGVSMDDSPEPVRPFYQQFHINYPLVMGTADVGSAYGGVLGLPVAFVIDRKGRIYSKHMGATDPAAFDKDVRALLEIP